MRKELIANISDSREMLAQSMRFIHESLSSLKLGDVELTHAELMSEESLVRLLEHADFTKIDRIRISVRKFLGNVSITIHIPGQEFGFNERMTEPLNPGEDFSPDSLEAMQNIFLRSFSPNLKYRHSGKYNVIHIKAVRSAYSALWRTLGALVSAVITGLLLRMYAPENVSMFLSNNVFELVRDVFMNLMKMCAIPVVLFSTALCLAEIGSLSGFRKTGAKLMRHFLMSQVIGVTVGAVLVIVFRTGAGSNLVAAAQEVSSSALSARQIVMSFIPENIVEPITSTNMIQLMVLAVLLGLAMGASGAKIMRSVFHELNDIFMKMTEFFMGMIPLVVFSSVASMIITAGVSTILSVAGIFFTTMAGFALMNVIYCLLVKFTASLNPFTMYRKSLAAIMTAFSTCSTSAALPDSMRASEAMGISSKLYSFALPFGASLNKNAFCLNLTVIVMGAANMYGVKLSAGAIITLCVSIILIAPGTSWAPVAAFSMLMSQAGVPLEAIGLVLGIYTLLDMADTVTNCMGTLSSTLIVAASENMLDREEYSKP